MTLREVFAIQDELFEEESVLEDNFVDEEVCEGEEEEEKYEAPKYSMVLVLRALKTQVVPTD